MSKEKAKVESMIPGERGKLTVKDIQDMKGQEQIVMFATNEPWIAAAAETAGVHIIRTWSYGGEDTSDKKRIQYLPTLVKQMRKAAPNVILNPYLEPRVVAASDETAIREAIRILHAGADIVLTLSITPQRLEAMAKEQIPVFAHVGLRPHWYTQWTGGYTRVGKTAEDALKIYQKAHDLQEAGAAMITIEMTPKEVTKAIAESLDIPVISIGAGAGADGAELVYHDLLGVSPRDIPSHAKQYRQLFKEAVGGLKEYHKDVQDLSYPDEEEHSWTMKDEEYEKFRNKLDQIT